MPRPQVRPDPPGRLLPAPGVLHPGPVPRRLPDRARPRERAAYEARLGRLGGRGRAGSRRRSSALEAPVRDALAPGLPPGSNDETAAAFAEARGRADAATRSAWSSTRWRRTGGSSRDAWPAVLDPSTRLGATALLARLDRLKKAGAARPAAGPGDRRGRARRAADLPPPPRRLHRQGRRGRAGVPGGLCRRASRGRRRSPAPTLERPAHGAGRLARPARSSADGPGDGQPALAAPLRPGDRRHAQRLRHDGRGADHPELLDWLATEFVARGWSLKAMHRLIVTSATYRQSSRPDPAALAADPDNALLWRHAPAAARRRGDPRRPARRLGPAQPGDGRARASSPSCPPS